MGKQNSHRIAAAFAAALGWSAAAHADTTTPPRLITFVAADYPSEAQEAGLEAAVELEIVVDGDGSVADVQVVAPVGHGFDQAALAAARRFVFEPARRDGHAFAARIRYRYVFELERPVVARTPDPEPLSPRPPAADPDATLVSPPPGAEAAGEFGATARVRETPPGSVTRRSVESHDLASAPGTRGDALRVVELLPGVARPPLSGDGIVLRGASPAESEVFFEGAQVLRLYHFGGITSFTNARLLDHVDLYPGNFSVRYGRKIGGVIDVGARDPRADGVHGVADVNLIDASMLVEGPVARGTSVLVAARRSFVDLFVGELMPPDTVLAAPVYEDYQALVTIRPTRRDRVRLMVYGSRDRLGLLLKNPPDADPAIQGEARQETYFHRTQAAWSHRYSDAVQHEVSLTAGTLGFIASIGPELHQDITGPEVFGRAEWRVRAAPWLRLTGGLDLSFQRLRAAYSGPAIGADEGDPAAHGPLTAMRRSTIDATANFNRPAGYAEAEVEPTRSLVVVAGLRADYFSDVEAWTLSPRATGRLTLAPGTLLKGGVGLFSQPPSYGQAVAGFGNPDLRPARASHYGLGIEQAAGDSLAFGMEGFFKTNRDLVVMAEGGGGLVNGGRGRIYGAEISGRVRPGTRVSGFLAYTLSRSERSDQGGAWRPFDYDQTHILTVAASVRPGRGWEIGGAFRLVTGNPETPIVGSVYEAGRDYYRPIYGPTNSTRNPSFHRLDLRVEKQWRPAGMRLATYLDLLNATNAKNREATSYSFDYMKQTPLNGLPILPSVGIRGEI